MQPNTMPPMQACCSAQHEPPPATRQQQVTAILSFKQMFPTCLAQRGPAIARDVLIRTKASAVIRDLNITALPVQVGKKIQLARLAVLFQ
jgi:hypothetical protein